MTVKEMEADLRKRVGFYFVICEEAHIHGCPSGSNTTLVWTLARVLMKGAPNGSGTYTYPRYFECADPNCPRRSTCTSGYRSTDTGGTANTGSKVGFRRGFVA